MDTAEPTMAQVKTAQVRITIFATVVVDPGDEELFGDPGDPHEAGHYFVPKRDGECLAIALTSERAEGHRRMQEKEGPHAWMGVLPIEHVLCFFADSESGEPRTDVEVHSFEVKRLG